MPLALISVYDKNGLEKFAQRLSRLGWTFLASGGTAATLRSAGIDTVDIAEYTGSAELLSGRVKTLHPAIHAGILARPDPADLEQLRAHGYKQIDLVVVNLYPFEKTVAQANVSETEIIEQIDIGGVALIRAAAKNFARVCVVCDPEDYERVALEEERGGIGAETRFKLAAKAFVRTANYDRAIAEWFSKKGGFGAEEATSKVAPADALPSTTFEFRGIVERTLRYGENPHQKAFFVVPLGDDEHGSLGGSLDFVHPRVRGPLGGRVLGGKELSYNNLLDLDAAWHAVLSFEQPAAVIVKHLSPCGAAEAENLKDAYEAALACDPVSAFGGIVALNRPLDTETALVLRELFLECVAAPGFEEEARDVLKGKKNLRLVEANPLVFQTLCKELRSAAGGLLVQEPDHGDPPDTHWRVVSARQPTVAEMDSLRFAWKLVQHVKSNAIVLAKGHASVGIGGGQTNRVDAVRQACERAGARAKGAVMASDAFFPFADSIEAAAEAGVTAVVHPGGSVRDAEVLAAADRLGLALVYTGVRHFRH